MTTTWEIIRTILEVIGAVALVVAAVIAIVAWALYSQRNEP